jgi:hypothetical protein
MLKEVIDGDTYETVAARFGVSRTAVERRIKAIAVQLSQVADIDGLNEDGAAFVRRLRLHRDAILTALVDFDPRKTVEHRSSRIVSMDEIIQAGKRIKGRSNRAWHDLSLFYLLFATGARPLEIARLEVRDYLNSDGKRSAPLPDACRGGHHWKGPPIALRQHEAGRIAFKLLGRAPEARAGLGTGWCLQRA